MSENKNEKLKDLLRYVQAEGRVCPMPQKWNELWEMLPNKKRASVGWEPSLPLILAAWYEVSAQDKKDRLSLHIKYADANNALEQIDQFIRLLKPDDWVYGDGITQWEEWRARRDN